MKQRRNNLFLIFVIFCSLLMISVPMNVIATIPPVTVSFETSEGGSSGQPFPVPGHTSIISSKYNTSSSPGSYFYTDSNTGLQTAKLGTQFMRMYASAGNSAYGWYNMTYQTDKYLTSWYCYISVPVQAAPASQQTYLSLYFYNKTVGRNNYGINMCYRLLGNGSLGWTLNGILLLYTANYSYTNVSWSILDNLGTCLYKAGNYTHTDVMHNTLYAINNYRIDRIYIVYNAPNGINTYYTNSVLFDDMRFTKSDSYMPVGGCLITAGLTPVGSFGHLTWEGWSKHISTTYQTPITTSIQGVELLISSIQYADDNDVLHYSCSINGNDISSPLCIDPYGDAYIIQWSCNIGLTNTPVTFDFYHSQKIVSESTGPNNVYWDVGVGYVSEDLNGDGVVGFKWTDNSVVYHWTLILGIPVLLPTYGAGVVTSPYDLGMRFWDTGFVTTKTYNYPATLGLSDYTNQNSTGYIYNLTRGFNTILGSYTLSTNVLAYKIYLYKNNTLLNSFIFPISCNYPGNGFGFAPDTIGNYTMQLNSTHALANVTAWVVGTCPNFDISTTPSVSDEFSTYTVNAHYYNPQGYTGGVSMDYISQSNLNIFTSCIIQHTSIQNNITTYFPYASLQTNPEYWGLYSHIGSLYALASSCTHIVRIPSISTNTVYTGQSNYPCSSLTLLSLSIQILGTHMFPGGNVNVYVNNITAKNVGNTQRFNFEYRPDHFGAYQITMYLNQKSSNILLCPPFNFTVSSTDLITPPPSPESQWFSFIPTNYYFLVAIVIIIGFAFMPLAVIYSIVSKLQSSTGITLKIPGTVMMIMTLITSLTGYILTIMWGLLAWWTVFILMFILIIIFGIFYYSRKNTSETNDTE